MKNILEKENIFNDLYSFFFFYCNGCNNFKKSDIEEI